MSGIGQFTKWLLSKQKDNNTLRSGLDYALFAWNNLQYEDNIEQLKTDLC